MNIDNIEKCQMLLEKRAGLLKAATMMGELKRYAQVTIQGAAHDAEKVEICDEDFNAALQDAIDARIQAIEKQIETL
ncbi:MAG: hypothetical protein ACI3ZK_07400 [Candidatus Cryptobacteroides sp.]